MLTFQRDYGLFIRFDEVKWDWQVVDPILKAWSQKTSYILTCPADRWGPKKAHRILDRKDQSWRNDT